MSDFASAMVQLKRLLEYLNDKSFAGTSFITLNVQNAISIVGAVPPGRPVLVITVTMPNVLEDFLCAVVDPWVCTWLKDNGVQTIDSALFGAPMLGNVMRDPNGDMKLVYVLEF